MHARERERIERTRRAGGRSGAGGAATIAELQRRVGNREVARLVANRRELQRLGVGEYFADAKKHVKELLGGESKQEGEPDPAEIAAPSEEVSKHAEMVTDALKLVAGCLRTKAMQAGDEIALGKANAIAEQAEAAGKTIETASGAFKKLTKWATLTYRLWQLKRSVERLDAIDITKNPKGAAEAFDSLFGDFGELAKLCPAEGPWMAWADFLAEFRNGFFAPMYDKVNVEGIYGPDRLREHGLDANWGSRD
jgi:hypothetical protein